MGTEHTPHDTARVPLGEPPGHRSPLATAVLAGVVLFTGGAGAYGASRAVSGAPSHQLTSPGDAQGRDGSLVPLLAGGWSSAATERRYSRALLPKGPASAPVYTARSRVPREDVVQLAAALGVTGPVVVDHGVWRAGAGGGPALQVSQDGPGSWVYTRSGPRCVPPVDPTSASGTALCYGSARVMQAATPAVGTVISPQGAERSAAPVLAALGIRHAQVDAAQTVGSLRTVTADPRVGGLPTHGWRTLIQVAPDGTLTSASGRLSRLTAGAVYPVVSAQQALTQLSQPAGGAPPRRCPTAPGPGVAPGTAAPCRASGRPPLRVRGAVFGLSAQYQAGLPTLVPSWLFHLAGFGAQHDAVMAQPAVDPRAIAVPSPWPSRADPSRVRIESYSASGTVMTLRFWGGLCSRYIASLVGQSADTVTVQVTAVAKRPGEVCVMLAKRFTAQLALPVALTGRTIVKDASTGQPVPRR